jgi:phage terminase large subunit-like protein
MVDQDRDLKQVIKPVLSKKRLVYLPTKSFYQVLSAEAFTKHGLNVSACIFDELHAQPNRALWDVMTFGAGDARLQPAWWVITTAGDDPDRQSVCWEVHKKAEGIMLGTRKDPTMYPVIFGFDPEEHRIWKGWKYELDTEATWETPKVWKAVNPSVDHTIKYKTVKQAYNTVKDSPAEEKNFKQLRLNIWHRDKVTKWLPLSMWIQCGQLVVPEKLEHRECYGGIDLSTKLDITAYVLLFPPIENDPLYRILPTFWIPEDNMKERVLRDHVKYDEWVKQGYIKTTPGNYIDYARIEKHILDSRKHFDVRGWGYDEWNAYETQQRLYAEGIPEDKMMIVRQGYKSISPSMRDLEAWVKNKMIAHGGNPVMQWMFGNVEVKTDENNNIRYIKGKNTEHIDGISALCSSIYAYKMLGEKLGHVYEKRGMRSLM